jgi:hypothetical protein
LTELPWRWRIPKLDDDDGWEKLQGMLAKLQAETIPRRRAIAQEKLSRVERQIEQVMRQDPSESRDMKLAKLRYEKRRIEEQYAEQRADDAPGSSGA